ncbi:MAG: hypothetical protein SF162_10465 [bacterium]|nr:hypothetical protein [bacterium]
MSRAETALQRLAEDTAWREDLIDSEADALMKWAESKVQQFDAESDDPLRFEAGIDSIRRTMRQINRLVGQRRALSKERQQVLLDEMAAACHVMPITPEELDATGNASPSFSAQAAPDESQANIALIGALTTWLDGGELPSAPLDDGRASVGEDALGALDAMRQQMSAVAQTVTAPEPAPAPPPDPAAMNAILGFFNAPSDSDTAPPAEDSHADTP